MRAQAFPTRSGCWRHFHIPQVWHVTDFGRAEIRAHALALRHAALHSGYKDHETDPYRHTEDMPRWQPRWEDYQRIYITAG